ncbi:MAG TPA: 6-phosphogluconolactonase [Ktedonobacterales bacterium]|nr:6-phosphogluconolactonase [Ktedonobacterales bacterium]
MNTPGALGAPTNRTVRVLPDAQAAAHAAAELFVARATDAQAQRGVFHVALSGGSTPRLFHQMLAASPLREQVDWSRIQFFWGDERCVPPDHPDSNYRMARATLLDAVPVPPDHIHRMRGEDNPAAAAQAYEDELRTVFAVAPGEAPRFDLIYTGMGPDGHTLSLFPHTAALSATDRLVVANHVPQLNSNRITFTSALANRAALVAFVITGADKATALAQVLEGPRDPERYPSQLIAPSGELLYLLDQYAAAQLTHTA